MKARHAAALLILSLPALAQTAPTSTFTDPAAGVSFTYPSTWLLSRQPSFYLPPLIVSPDQPARAIVFLSRSGAAYAKTNLGGLEFTYVAAPESSQTSCLNRVTRNVNPDSKPEAVTINGTPFLHIKSGDAGMCHQASRNNYEVFRDQTCILFEAAFYTTCPDPDDGIRQLTAEESKALSTQLDAIIRTVHLSPGAAAAPPPH